MNLFLIETPHQVLNAVEARHRFGVSGARLAVLVAAEYGRSAYEAIATESGWEDVVCIVPPDDATVRASRGWFGALSVRAAVFLADLRRRQMLDALARCTGRVESLFLGNYLMPHMRHFTNRIRGERVYLLDDGTATLAINEERRRFMSQPGSPRRIRAMYRVRTRLLGLDERHLDRVTFFSTYDLDPAEGDSVVKNDYRYLRSLAAEHEPSDEVFFLGQPMVEDSLITSETFFSYMGRVVRRFAGSKLVYLPHKREREEKTRELERQFGLQIRRFDVPIEYQMSVRGTRPRVLASFFSSALENSRIIFGSLMPIQCFRMRSEDFLYRRERITQIYAHFASRQDAAFEVIDLGGAGEADEAVRPGGGNGVPSGSGHHLARSP